MPARWLAVLAVGVVLGAVQPGVSAQAPTPAPLFGVAYGNQGWDMDAVRALEAWQGRPNDVLVMFTAWNTDAHIVDNLFEHQLPAIWDHGTVPVITWEPFTGDTTAPDIVSRIAKGEYDAYVSRWATRLRTFLAGADGRFGTADDRRAYLRLAHEMNGNWYPWGQRAPDRFITMWRRVHQIFDDLGVGRSHLQWMWCVTNVDHGPFRAEAYFPGDECVDWVAVDGYNWGVTGASTRWRSPASVLEPMLARVQALTSRPLALAEVATTRHTEDGDKVSAKNRWIGDFFTWLATTDVRMVSWFNLDRDADFAVFGGELGDVTVRVGRRDVHAYSAYRDALRRWPPARDRARPRLISDAVFTGR